ncbi:MAG: fibronectin type III domain-containing protein [Acidobacteria bacterium]|nr:fibronectin type III domain-containing protein [Acidobacteriota bacterium]MCL5287224.1 fibronectin type III domain-containing protein [Acidobacteriota bacterium]
MDTPIGLLLQARKLVVEKPAPAFGWIWRWGAATAVAAALVLALTLRLDRQQTLPTQLAPPAAPAVVPAAPALMPPSDATSAHAVRKSGRKAPLPEILFPKEGAVLSSGPVEVRWKGIPGAIHYEVQVVTADGDIIGEGRAETTNALLPIGKSVKPGAKYFLWVRAHLPNGKTVRSAVVSFQTAAP